MMTVNTDRTIFPQHPPYGRCGRYFAGFSCAREPEKNTAYLEYMSIMEKAPDKPKGWGNLVKGQFTGK